MEPVTTGVCLGLAGLLWLWRRRSTRRAEKVWDEVAEALALRVQGRKLALGLAEQHTLPGSRVLGRAGRLTTQLDFNRVLSVALPDGLDLTVRVNGHWFRRTLIVLAGESLPVELSFPEGREVRRDGGDGLHGPPRRVAAILDAKTYHLVARFVQCGGSLSRGVCRLELPFLAGDYEELRTHIVLVRDLGQRLAQRAQLPVHAGLAEQILEDEDPKVRQRCLELLFESLASDPVVPVLDKVAAHALADEDLGTRARAALALAYLPTWSARAHVVLTACGALGASRVLAEALAAFPPPFGEEAREKGSSELSPNLIRDHQDLLLSLLNARDSVVVTRAAETLGRVADERAVNALLKAQAHPDDAVRLVAQQALRQVHSRHLSLAQGTLALAEHDAATGALSEAVSEGGLSHVDLAETLGSDHGGESHERG